MQTIIIQTKADKSIIKAIKTLILASDKDVIISDHYLSKNLDEIRAEVKDTIEQIKKGTMELYTFEESYQRTDELLKRLEAK